MLNQSKQVGSSACISMEVLFQHVLNAEKLSERQCDAVVDHLAICTSCAQYYDALCEAEEAVWEDAAGASALPKRKLQFTRSPEESIDDLWRRVGKANVSRRPQRAHGTIFRAIKFAASLAACLALFIAGRWLLTPLLSPIPIGHQAYVELVTANKRQSIPLGQAVATGNQSQEFRLNDMHRVVLNRNAAATFKLNGKGTIEIQFSRGEMYVDALAENPLIVTTSNARLIVNGAQFDARTTADKTEVTPLKG